MHTPFKYFAILTAIAQLPLLCLATWKPGKAAQINFYVGGTCAQYTSETTTWWTLSPLVGGSGAVTAAECFVLGMPGDSTGINTAMMWEESTTSDTVEPDQANGWCTFWDGFDCTGNQVSSDYAPAGAGGGPCQSARSKDGFLWKSAKCFINATTAPFPSEAPLLTSSLTSSPASTSTIPSTITTSPSTTSFSTSISRTSTTPPFSTSLSRSPTTSTFISSSQTSTTMSSSASAPGYSSISASLASAITPPESITHATRKSLSSATIAGVITGAVSLVVLAVLFVFCIWRRGRKKPEAILPYVIQEAQRGSPALSEKSRGSGTDIHSPTPGERRRHRSLVANELRALREEMERLNSAMTSGDGNDARIRALERELQSYGGAEYVGTSLPGYHD